MRLDRFISEGMRVPRKHALTMVKSGQVTVDGVVVRDAGLQIADGHTGVCHHDVPIAPATSLLLILYKPMGHVTTTEEGRGPTVMDLVPEPLRRKDLAPIGRLDKDTTGLLLLTTEGSINHALTHPRRHVEKAYVAGIDIPLDPNAAERFAAGLTLADGTLCQPAELEVLAPLQLRIVVREGRFHQVKRMVATCGATVLTLHRERIGQLLLPEDLVPGQCRPLTTAESAILGIFTANGDAPA